MDASFHTTDATEMNCPQCDTPMEVGNLTLKAWGVGLAPQAHLNFENELLVKDQYLPVIGFFDEGTSLTAFRCPKCCVVCFQYGDHCAAKVNRVFASPFTAPRLLSAAIAAPFTAMAVLVLRNQLRVGGDLIGGLAGFLLATLALLSWWFALRGHIEESRRRMGYSVFGGAILGGIGFMAGFVGPMIFAPHANQGPLLGIFITGPAGLVVGAALGWLYATAGAPAGRLATRTYDIEEYHTGDEPRHGF